MRCRRLRLPGRCVNAQCGVVDGDYQVTQRLDREVDGVGDRPGNVFGYGCLHRQVAVCLWTEFIEQAQNRFLVSFLFFRLAFGRLAGVGRQRIDIDEADEDQDTQCHRAVTVFRFEQALFLGALVGAANIACIRQQVVAHLRQRCRTGMRLHQRRRQWIHGIHRDFHAQVQCLGLANFIRNRTAGDALQPELRVAIIHRVHDLREIRQIAVDAILCRCDIGATTHNRVHVTQQALSETGLAAEVVQPVAAAGDIATLRKAVENAIELREQLRHVGIDHFQIVVGHVDGVFRCQHRAGRFPALARPGRLHQWHFVLQATGGAAPARTAFQHLPQIGRSGITAVLQCPECFAVARHDRLRSTGNVLRRCADLWQHLQEVLILLRQSRVQNERVHCESHKQWCENHHEERQSSWFTCTLSHGLAHPE